MDIILGILVSTIAVFLIFLVLIQKGKGGGLAGAFGAPGGASAFGTKAGDLFMYITIVVAAIWISTCVLTIYLTHPRSQIGGSQPATPTVTSDGAGGTDTADPDAGGADAGGAGAGAPDNSSDSQ